MLMSFTMVLKTSPLIRRLHVYLTLEQATVDPIFFTPCFVFYCAYMCIQVVMDSGVLIFLGRKSGVYVNGSGLPLSLKNRNLKLIFKGQKSEKP